jgi:hypothetical protein
MFSTNLELMLQYMLHPNYKIYNTWFFIAASHFNAIPAPGKKIESVPAPASAPTLLLSIK